MHPNQAFRKPTSNQNIAFARQASFGTLAISHDNGPLISHIPFQICAANTTLEFHLVRSNPIVKLASQPINAVIAVTGPDGYISPDWYGIENQVPTWNYVAVHLRGKIQQLDQNQLPGILERLSDAMEQRLAPKPVWKMGKVDHPTLEKMQKMIVPFKMSITEINGTWKLSQNKPAPARLGASDSVETNKVGTETNELARLMRQTPNP